MSLVLFAATRSGKVRTLASILSKYGTNAHAWLPGASGVSVSGLPTNNYLLSDGSTGYSTVDGVDGLVKDAMDPVTGINLTQATTANKPLVRRGMLNLIPSSNDLTAWFKSGATTPSASTVSFTATGQYVSKGAALVTGVGSKVTAAFLLSGVGTTSIAVTSVGGVYEDASLQITLTTTPTLYAVTVTYANAHTSSQAALIRAAPTSDTATSVTVGGGGLFAGTWTAAQILAEGGIPTTTATAASNPTSGKYWWSFDGSNDSLLSGNLGITNACTIVIAGRVNSLAAPNFFICEDANGAFCYVNTAGTIYFGKNTIASVVNSSTGAIVVGVPFVITCRLSGGTAVIRKNGVQVATAATALTFTATTGARIGSRFDTTDPLGGALGWVVPIASALSDADCLTVEQLAAAQFPGLTTPDGDALALLLEDGSGFLTMETGDLLLLE